MFQNDLKIVCLNVQGYFHLEILNGKTRFIYKGLHWPGSLMHRKIRHVLGYGHGPSSSSFGTLQELLETFNIRYLA